MFLPFWDPTMVLLIPALILAAYAQAKVQSTYAKYSQIRSASGRTGREIAQAILSANDIPGRDTSRTITIPSRRPSSSRRRTIRIPPSPP